MKLLFDRNLSSGLVQLLAGPPPKIIWVRLGNCTTDDIVAALRQRADDLQDFASAPEAAFLVVA